MSTGSRTVFNPDAQLIQLNVAKFDAIKHNATALIADPRRGLELLSEQLGAISEYVHGIEELEAALERAKAADQNYLITLDTDPVSTTQAGGHPGRWPLVGCGRTRGLRAY